MMKFFKTILMSIAFMLCLTVATASAADVSAVRWSNYRDVKLDAVGTRIVLDLPAIPQVKSTFKQGTLTANITGVLPGKNVGELAIRNNSVKSVRIENVEGKDTRVSITLNPTIAKDALRVFTLRKDLGAGRPDRLVIDIFDKKPVVPSMDLSKSSKPNNAKVKNAPDAGTDANVSPLYKKYVLDERDKAKKSSLGGKNIVLDPGHGGSDPGAIGPGGTQEKNVNLSVSKKVAFLLSQRKANVRMSRTTDIDVLGKNATDVQDLQYRVDVGTNFKADVFVSIHSNSSPNRNVKGSTTYYYLKTPQDSLLAGNVQDRLVEFANLDNLGTRTAGFYVIKNSKMPAILIELGFLSNEEEEKLLASSDFQDKLAYGIVVGLEDYFKARGKK